MTLTATVTLFLVIVNNVHSFDGDDGFGDDFASGSGGKLFSFLFLHKKVFLIS